MQLYYYFILQLLMFVNSSITDNFLSKCSCKETNRLQKQLHSGPPARNMSVIYSDRFCYYSEHNTS